MSSAPALVPVASPPRSSPPWLPTPLLVSQYPMLAHLHSCTSMKQLHQMHANAITSGAIFDNFVASRILSFSALSPYGSLSYARLLFSRLRKPDTFTFNTLLRAYVCGPDPLNAVLFYIDVLNSSALHRPDNHCFALLLKACSEAPSLSLGVMVHAQAIKFGWSSLVSVQNFLVHMYASCGDIGLAKLAFNGIEECDDASVNMMLGGFLKCGCFEGARQLFDEMSERDGITWSVMINGLVQRSRFKEGLEFFRRMLEEKVEPNESVLVNVLNACAHLGAMEQGMWVERYLKGKSIRFSVRVGTALVDMYLKCGCVEKAYEIFARMEEKNVLAWTAMIGGLAINGRGEEALQLFSQMEMEGVSPNDVTFIGVLNACSHAGLVDDGVKYFSSMTEVYGIEPNVQHYCCLVDLYGRCGMLHQAEEVIKKMPMKPNSAVWGALLNSCRIHGNSLLGEVVGKKLIELESNNSGRYVLLSNIYAANGRWENVAELRRVMKERGVTKLPGSSFIDLKGHVYEFVAGDNVHPQSKEIYVMLSVMMKKLMQAGYKANTGEALLGMDEEEKETAVSYHSEKLALAFGLINTEPGTTIRITKNLRVCSDCHTATKMLSKIYDRVFVVRDRGRFHHFKDGICSCNDFW
ncbi:Tetratricopeptide-like helical domain-containing protein [Dioscorea alata]|uniref:Tetratricopeptide-like helical domain-containing protein n=1 Tax=Dioscorea alata TaxID=55571 RepID=A0ACB7UNF0_DIOAL|nr:Tetratricopeptide-like helical domain-containing protein [Dioscorea alata]